MIFHEQPTDPWIKFDFLLLEAYQILNDETCPKCGHPIWLCRSTSQNIEFKVNSTICYAERAMKEYEDHKKPVKDRTPGKERKDWGRIHFTSPFVPLNMGDDFPTRTEFYEEMTKSQQ